MGADVEIDSFEVGRPPSDSIREFPTQDADGTKEAASLGGQKIVATTVANARIENFIVGVSLGIRDSRQTLVQGEEFEL